MKKRSSKNGVNPPCSELAPAEQFGSLQTQPNDPVCHLVAKSRNTCRLLICGNLARRKILPSPIVWDTQLSGFGLRARKSGGHRWIVKLRERGRQRLITLGKTTELDADAARSRARDLLAQAALDGLPRRSRRKVSPLLRDYAPEFWRDYAQHWKPSTARSNERLIRRELLPVFGDLAIDAISRANVLQWRDTLFERSGIFNRALPVLAVMLSYAEQLGYRRQGSNPCKGVPRHKRKLPERYLSPVEYRRLARALAEAEPNQPAVVAIIRLLIFTGARKGEIESLRWDDVAPPRLHLPDSKTGPKTVWLNAPARAVLEAWGAGKERAGFVFPASRGESHIRIDLPWNRLRRRAALPDVRIHDVRHSFASIAIGDGISLSLIGRLLGHALPETTARYAHLADELVADAAQRVCGGLAAALGLPE